MSGDYFVSTVAVPVMCRAKLEEREVKEAQMEVLEVFNSSGVYKSQNTESNFLINNSYFNPFYITKFILKRLVPVQANTML